LSDVSIGSSEPGLRTQAWAANCVAIGEAACMFDPLFDLELHAIQLGIVHLLSLFPAAPEAAAERAQFNRTMRSLFERLRDFQSAVYVLCGGTAATPTGLQQKIALFEARGTIAPMEDESFSPDQWRAMFVGLGLAPESWPPAIDTTAPETMKEGFRRILRFVHDKVLEQPKHDDYLADLGVGGAA
jgi:tryptophan halogenase